MVKKQYKDTNLVYTYDGKVTIMIYIMMIGMMTMAKGYIIDNQPENIRKLKSI